METVRFEIWRRSDSANRNALALVLIVPGDSPLAEGHLLFVDMEVPKDRATRISADSSKRVLMLAAFRHILQVNSPSYHTGDLDVDALLPVMRQAAATIKQEQFVTQA